MNNIPTKYPPEFKERAIRMVNTKLQDHDAPSTTRAIKDTATNSASPSTA